MSLRPPVAAPPVSRHPPPATKTTCCEAAVDIDLPTHKLFASKGCGCFTRWSIKAEAQIAPACPQLRPRTGGKAPTDQQRNTNETKKDQHQRKPKPPTLEKTTCIPLLSCLVMDPHALAGARAQDDEGCALVIKQIAPSHSACLKDWLIWLATSILSLCHSFLRNSC